MTCHSRPGFFQLNHPDSYLSLGMPAIQAPMSPTDKKSEF